MKQYTINYDGVTTHFELVVTDTETGAMTREGSATTHPALMLAWEWTRQQPLAVQRIWKAAQLVIAGAVDVRSQEVATVMSNGKQYVVRAQDGTVTCSTWREGDRNTNYTGSYIQCPDHTYNHCTLTSTTGHTHTVCKHTLAVMMAQELARRAATGLMAQARKVAESREVEQAVVQNAPTLVEREARLARIVEEKRARQRYYNSTDGARAYVMKAYANGARSEAAGSKLAQKHAQVRTAEVACREREQAAAQPKGENWAMQQYRMLNEFEGGYRG